MVTETEETQAKEFLKRAEIRTMKKDLRALREVDALKERDKIATIKTLEEQLEEKQKFEQSASQKAAADKAGMEEVLQKNEGQEKIAEKDLKNYATEEERQKIFLLESQRLGFEKQIDAIDKERDPALKLEKNKLLLKKREQQTKLNSILDEEKNLEGEEKVITEKEQTTTIPAERKGLEKARWDLDKKIQDVEKKRWEAEKQIEDTDNRVTQIDTSSEQLVIEKNGLQNKVLGVDKSLREIYSVVMAREEEKRRGLAQEQIAEREALAKVRAEQKEKIQREQWSPTATKKNEGYLSKAPQSFKEKVIQSSEIEEEQREKFMQDVGTLSQNKEKGPNPKGTPTAPQAPTAPIPPVPRKIN